jgi:hypothetical protein
VWAFIHPVKSISFQHRMQHWLTKAKRSAEKHTPEDKEALADKPIDVSKGGHNKAAGAGRSLRRRLPF